MVFVTFGLGNFLCASTSEPTSLGWLDSLLTWAPCIPWGLLLKGHILSAHESVISPGVLNVGSH